MLGPLHPASTDQSNKDQSEPPTIDLKGRAADALEVQTCLVAPRGAAG
jgi:hypothetical protein